MKQIYLILILSFFYSCNSDDVAGNDESETGMNEQSSDLKMDTSIKFVSEKKATPQLSYLFKRVQNYFGHKYEVESIYEKDSVSNYEFIHSTINVIGLDQVKFMGKAPSPNKQGKYQKLPHNTLMRLTYENVHQCDYAFEQLMLDADQKPNRLMNIFKSGALAFVVGTSVYIISTRSCDSNEEFENIQTTIRDSVFLGLNYTVLVKECGVNFSILRRYPN